MLGRWTASLDSLVIIMASENEARIRDKTEAALRAKYPMARIVHELPLEPFKIRIDIAAICETRIIVAEIKSEKDTLKRLKAQLVRAASLACETWLVANEAHTQDLDKMLLYQWEGAPDPELADLCRNKVQFFIEKESNPYFHSFNKARETTPLINGAHLFDLLWADEMANMLRYLGLIRPVKAHPSRMQMTYIAIENLGIKQIRAGVCTALRRRIFARADNIMES